MNLFSTIPRFNKSIFFYLILVFIILFLFILIRPKQSIDIAFYYWKSEFNLSKHEQELIQNSKSKRLYLHFFDVDKAPGSKEAIPKAQLRLGQDIPAELDIIPVIYITQRCFNEVNSAELKLLAHRIVTLSQQMSKDLTNKWVEFQIDCDWTAKNKAAYFEFLSSLKTELPEGLPISATIRLHQIKYPEKTGVPPVDRGALMFYNMGEIQEYTSRNSLYDYTTAASYVNRLPEYALPLDYAFPLFGWGLHYRLNKLQNILSEDQIEEIKQSSAFIHHRNVHICTTTGYYGSGYFFRGDLVEEERVDIELCKLAARQLSEHISQNHFKLIFYHLGSKEFQQYDSKQLEAIRSYFN